MIRKAYEDNSEGNGNGNSPKRGRGRPKGSKNKNSFRLYNVDVPMEGMKLEELVDDDVVDNNGLTFRQATFCAEYLKDLSQTKALIRAGYSPNSNYNLLAVPVVRNRISELMRIRSERTGITEDRILVELFNIATLDIGELYDENGSMRNIQDMPPRVRRAITRIESEEIYSGRGNERELIGYIKRAMLADKMRALELLLKHIVGFKEKETNGNVEENYNRLDLKDFSSEELTVMLNIGLKLKCKSSVGELIESEVVK